MTLHQLKNMQLECYFASLFLFFFHFSASVHQMATLPEVNIKVIKTYSTNLICVDRVLTLDHQTALISNILIPALNRIHINDKDVVDIQTLNGASVHDMTKTPSGVVLLTVWNNNSTDV